MLPGGTTNTPFTKSAMTRANNSTKNAARATMVGNPAAKQSIRNQTSAVKGVSGQAAPMHQSIQNANPQPMQPLLQNVQGNNKVAAPTGGPQMPVGAATGFDPGVFLDQQIGNFVGQVKLRQFIESPRVKDAMESIRLKNLMNYDNPSYQKDPRSLFQQVVDKIGMRDG